MVMGALAGEIELSVPCLYPKPGVLRPVRCLRTRQSDPVFAVQLKWWGDSGPGTVLKPNILNTRDANEERARQEALSSINCALFPVRCGLDGLVTYLKDMVRALQIPKDNCG